MRTPTIDTYISTILCFNIGPSCFSIDSKSYYFRARKKYDA